MKLLDQNSTDGNPVLEIRCKYDFPLDFLELDQITVESFNHLNSDQLLCLVNTLIDGARQAREWRGAGHKVRGLSSWVVSYVCGESREKCHEFAAKFEMLACLAWEKFLTTPPIHAAAGWN